MIRPWAGLSSRRFFVAVLLTGLAAASVAQMIPVRERAYWEMVAEYARGDREKALTTITTWSDRDFESITRRVSDLSKVAERCRDCEARATFDALPLRAAILLQGERDRRDRVARVREAGGDPDCGTEIHGAMAQRLLWLAALQPGGEEFLGRFAAATSLHFRALLCFGRAKVWSEAALEWQPGDADLFLVRGLIYEATGTLVTDPATRERGPDLKGRYTKIFDAGNTDAQLKQAVSAYEKALAVNPQLAEAHLHLGRTQWRLKNFQAARDSLTRAMERSKGRVLYLAHLFRGRVLEDEGHPEGAISDYTAARSVEPLSQIAALALAHVLSQRGESDRAQETLEGALSMAQKGRGADVYWSYLVGNPAATEGIFNALRAETGR